MPPRPLILTIIGNESRLRILLALAKHISDSLSVYKIAKFSGLERKVIRPHLRKLVEAELVQAKKYGPIFVYSLNKESTPVQRLMDLFNDSRLLAEAPAPLICYPMRQAPSFH
jgi:DNA-binding transcriptional ArsR family regulator